MTKFHTQEVGEQPLQNPHPGNRVKSPIINRPYDEPEHHLKLDPDSSSNDYVKLPERREPGHVFENPENGHKATDLRNIDPFPRIAEIRKQVKQWRNAGYPGIDRNTNRLLHHWTSRDTSRNNRIFFCQQEAIETLIWLETCRPPEILDQINEANQTYNDGLPRLATKMATGTGKTAVMAMAILYYALRQKNPIRTFLVVTPGITVTDRLDELYPQPNKTAKNIYEALDLIPPSLEMPPFEIKVIHRHLLEAKQDQQNRINNKDLSSETKKFLKNIAEEEAAKHPEGRVVQQIETIDEIMDRILGGRRPENTPLIILNDEGHHCYNSTKNNRDEQDARQWFRAVREIAQKSRFQVHKIHDFSATPFWIASITNRKLPPIFPWTVSDFPLIEAVEAGLVKIPRLPEHDPEKLKEGVSLKNLYRKISGSIPPDIANHLDILVHHHVKKSRKAYRKTKQNPILCIVARDIKDARAFFQLIGGKLNPETGRADPAHKGICPELSNFNEDGTIKENPPTLLVHSRIDGKSGDTTTIKDEDMLHIFGNPEAKNNKKELAQTVRDQFMTAGRPNEPGEHIRCIVSVSMLTEGWDCRTVTDIFGFRPFGSDLLTEQVTGRALRRTDHVIDSETGLFHEQHANLIGVPFSWMPEGNSPEQPPQQAETHTCEALDGAEHLRIEMPNVQNYEFLSESVQRKLDPNNVQNHGLVIQHSIDGYTVAFANGSRETLTRSQQEATENVIVWRIAASATHLLATPSPEPPERDPIAERLPVITDLLAAARNWLQHPTVVTQHFEQAFAGESPAHRNIAEACAEALILSLKSASVQAPRIRPVIDEKRPWLSSASPRRFETTATHVHEPTVKSERNLAPCDSHAEAEICAILDESPHVEAWLRNNIPIGFTIPYRDLNGHMQIYVPDFVVKTPKGNHLVIEFKGIWPGQSIELENAKKTFTEERWIPALNDDPHIKTRWGFLWLETTLALKQDIETSIRQLDRETS